MRTLTIRWQRLVDAKGATCPRCGTTGSEVERAAATLARRLRPAGVRVRAVTRKLSPAEFRRDPSASNRI